MTAPAFVGRRPELAALELRWAGSVQGSPQTVFVGGEPGAGKSRLVAEVAQALELQGVTVVAGFCVSDMGAVYDPFVEPVRALLPRLRDTSGLDETRLDLLGMLDLLIHSAGTQESSGPQFSPQLFGAVCEAFRQTAQDRPVLLVLEDMHWAGESAVRLLHWIVERCGPAQLMVLVTHRSTHPDRSAQLVRVISDLYRHENVGRLDLGGLSTEEITEYLRRELRAPLGAARGAAAFLRDQTGGNPFLLREVCRTLGKPGDLAALSRSDLHAPISVRAAAEARLERLSAAELRVLEAAAVIGEALELPLLCAVLAEGDGSGANLSVTTDRVMGIVDLLLAAGWLEPVTDAAGAFRLPHALARASVLASMSALATARIQARVARALEDEFPAAENRIQRLAHHYTSATALGYGAKASTYLAQAATMAWTALAHADAADLFARAAELADLPERRDDLRLSAARSFLQASHWRRARDLNALVANSGTPSQRLRAAIGFEATSWRGGERGEPSIQLIRAVIGQPDFDPADPLFARALAGLGRAHAFAGHRQEGIDTCRRAVELARERADPALLASVLQVSLQDNSGLDGMDDRLRRADEVTQIANELGAMNHLGAASYHRCVISYLRGDARALAVARRDLGRMTIATGQPYWQWVLTNIDFSCQLMAADFDAAEASARECLRLITLFEGGQGGGEGTWGLQQFILRRERGRLAAVRGLIDGYVQDSSTWLPGLLAMYSEFGMSDETRRILHRILGGEIERRAASASWPAVLTFLVEAATRLRDVRAAEQLYPMAMRWAGLNLLASEFLAPLGSADRLIGCLESVLRMPGASPWFESALATETAMNAPLHQATTLAEYALHLRQFPDSASRAQQRTRQALELADRYGLGRVRTLLALPGGHRGPAGAPAVELTAREFEVLALVGQGLSNQEIADTLVISVHTAANHIRSILLKTGCANRTQAAIYVASQKPAGELPAVSP